MRASRETTSVVLVHGAWADGSSWNDIIGPLLSKGLNVLAAPIPLTSLSDDVAALDRALERTDGPVVLVAHAYAGAVIAANTNERVRSLVFIAALAPDEGETVAEMFYREKPHPAGTAIGARCAWAHLDAARGIWHRFRSTCVPRTGCTFCRNTAANRCRVHSGEGSETRLESKAVLVPRRRRRPDDQPGHSALYGATHGRAHPIGEGRPYAIGHRAGAGHRSDPRSRGELAVDPFDPHNPLMNHWLHT